MDTGQLISQHEFLQRCIYEGCKQFNARIAVVGTKTSAALLLKIIDNTDIPLAGVFENDRFKEKSTLLGHPVRSILELSELKPEDVVVIASSAEATDLYDTFMAIQSLCACKTVHLKSLLDVFLLRQDLKAPLKFEYDDFLFRPEFVRGDQQIPRWHEVPPGVDFKDKTVLELGPAEGQATFMLLEQQAKKVIGLEARPLNYAKIATIRALYNWKNHELILGDMHLFPQLVKDKIDIIFCAGVFYHSAKPWWLLQTCMEHCDTIVLNGYVASEHTPPPRITREVILESGIYQFDERTEHGWDDCLSGVTKKALWFREEDLERFIDYNGFLYRQSDSHITPVGKLIRSVITKK